MKMLSMLQGMFLHILIRKVQILVIGPFSDSWTFPPNINFPTSNAGLLADFSLKWLMHTATIKILIEILGILLCKQLGNQLYKERYIRQPSSRRQS